MEFFIRKGQTLQPSRESLASFVVGLKNIAKLFKIATKLIFDSALHDLKSK